MPTGFLNVAPVSVDFTVIRSQFKMLVQLQRKHVCQ